MPSELKVIDPALLPLAESIAAGRRLSAEDGAALYDSRDVHGIGRLANYVREKLHGDKTYYNRNRHIN
jgi:aminodeoxyfutalosine synthase